LELAVWGFDDSSIVTGVELGLAIAERRSIVRARAHGSKEPENETASDHALGHS